MSYIIETGQGYVTLEHIINRFSTDIGEARCFKAESEAKYHGETNSLLDWMVLPRFAHTLDALDIWAALSPVRAKAWHDDNICTNAGVNSAIALDKAHEADVQEAFYKDTSTVNCRDNCGLVSIQDLIRMSGWKKS